MSTDGSRFDPRFDAAFQPGFDGPLQAPARPATSEPSSELTAPPRPAAPARPTGQPDVSPDGEPPAEADAATGEPRGRNPYLVALAVLGVVLVAVGGAIIAQARTLFDSNRADLDYVTIQLMLVSGPVAIALGIAIGASLLVILSVRWRR